MIAGSTEIAFIVEAHREAQSHAAYWHARCVAWTEAHGRSIWRERHPADVEKLTMRRRWRAYSRETAARVRAALSSAAVEGIS